MTLQLLIHVLDDENSPDEDERFALAALHATPDSPAAQDTDAQQAVLTGEGEVQAVRRLL